MTWNDLKFAIRSLRKSPSMTLTALAALTLGIGANTALFTVVNAVLLRPMNYPDPGKIAQVTRSWQNGLYNGTAVTPTKYEFWRRENKSFAALGAYNFGLLGMNLAGQAEPERITSLPVSADFFRVLGVAPRLGRTFTEQEDKPGAGHFAVISHPLWQRVFHSDPNVVGKALALNTANYTVIGVMPSDFDFPLRADLWTPLQLVVDPADHSNNYSVIGRMKPGVTQPQASADMRLVADRFRSQFGEGIMMDKGEGIGVINFHTWIVGNVKSSLLVLMGAVGFVLLIACANVANLLLARSAVRQHEMAVRTALGASSWQLMRLLFTESFVLALTGSALGVAIAYVVVPALLALAPASLPLPLHVDMGWRVLLFSAAIAIFTGVLFGLFPALQSSHRGIGSPLRDAGTRTTTSAAANRARQILVVAEVAISLVLLIGAGLLIQTFKNVSGVAPGFDVNHVLTMQMSVSDERFKTTAATSEMARRVITRLEAIPGVEAVGTITSLPTEPGFDDPFEIIGRPPSSDVFDEFMRVVSPNYFSALHIPVTQGRAFTEQDVQHGHNVIIINQALAHKYFPNENPIGKQLLVGRIMGPLFADTPREIVGVVGDTRDQGLDSPPRPIFFEPLSQLPDGIMALGNQLIPVNWVIRTSGDPLALADQIRRETLAASGGVPMAEPRLLEQVIGNSIASRRFTMTLLGILAGLAILLGAIGLYGVISYSVAQRTRELGIRAALGARRRDLSRLVIQQGMWLVGLGLAVGFVAAFGLTKFLEGMLYGVSAFDPVVLSIVTTILACVALTACWIPARRAARVDPVIALRDQ